MTYKTEKERKEGVRIKCKKYKATPKGTYSVNKSRAKGKGLKLSLILKQLEEL